MSNPIFNKFLSRDKALSSNSSRNLSVSSNEHVLDNDYSADAVAIDSTSMTITGAINKTLILFSFLFISAAYTWGNLMAGFVDRVHMLTVGGAVVGFILAMIIIFSKNKTLYKYLTPVYALAEGCFIGGISAFFESSIAGLVAQAVIATLVTILTMLTLFRTGIIRATEKFRSILFTATLSIGAIYLIQFIASVFFGRSIPQIFTVSPIGIGFSLFVVGIAALNLINDFDFIEKGAQYGLEKEYEWYGAFGLMVTIVWLYIEILHLLAKIAASRD